MGAGNIMVIWDRMGDYHRARWKSLSDHFTESKVIAADFGSSDHLYGWNNTELSPGYHLLSDRRPDEFDFRRVSRFLKIIKDKSIDVVCIPGYGRLEYVFFLILCFIKGKKTILFAESWYPGNIVVDFLKGLFLRIAVDGFLVSGKNAFAHFSDRLKISKIKMRIGYSVVDNEHFSSDRKGERINHSKSILSVARFSPEKNLERLVEAFVDSKLISKGWELTLVGGGPDQERLKIKIEKFPSIHLLPWQKYDALPSLYGSARIFVLPSLFEPWGLVINEAMSAGLPVIMSDQVGCANDLLDSGKNGWTFAATDKSQLVEIFNKLEQISSDQLDIMGYKSKEIVSNFTTRHFALAISELINLK